MELSKSIIAIALVSALSACGGSSNSNNSITEPQTPTPEPIQTVIGGKAIKGTMANAIVTVFKFVDGLPVALTDTELSSDGIVTGTDGSYTFTVLDYSGPVKIELSVGANTTMICDAPAGCAGVAYGDTIQLIGVDPYLKLSSISTVSDDDSGTVSLNVSALTHLAAEMIEAKAKESGTADNNLVDEQSSIIANAFNIMGSITALEPTTVENSAAVTNEDNADELRYGLINAAIMATLFSGEADSGAILSEKLAQIAADLVENDGALLVNQDANNEGFELSLVDVLDAAGEIANVMAAAIAADPDLADSDVALAAIATLEQQETNLENQAQYEEANADAEGRSSTEVEVPTEGDAVAKAKAMVEDVLLLGHLFKLGSDSNDAITTEGDKYIALIDSAGVMVEAEAASFLLLADLTDALSTIGMMYEAGTIEAGTFPIDSYLSTEGAVGTITFDTKTANGGILFTINATSGEEKVTLNAEVTFAEDGLSITLNIDGSIESAGAMLSLTEGSFAKVNLESAITRASLEDDSFEGEITSGELALEVVLEQKSSDAVTDPVTFTGVINTTLKPVSVPTISKSYHFDDWNQKEELIYSFPEMETAILPELLTLNGSFSSLDGNLIKATLTVNIQDLENYEAPDFEYVGKKVEGLLNISVSEDLNTIILTKADVVADNEQVVSTSTFTATGTGNWSNLVSVTTEDPELHRWGTGYELKHFSRPFDTDLNETGFIYTLAWIVGIENNNYYAVSIRVTPVDNDTDGEVDGFSVERIQSDDDSTLYNTEDMIDDEGNIQLSAFVNDNGDILTADGQPITWDDNYILETYLTIDEIVKYGVGGIAVNPFMTFNGAQFFAKTNAKFSFSVDDIGKAELILSEEQLDSIATGDISELNPTAYVTKALLKDVFTIAVSEDENTVTTSIDGSNSSTVRTFAYSGDNNVAGNFETLTLKTKNDGYTYQVKEWSETNDIGLDFPEIIFSKSNDEHSWHSQRKIIPSDFNGDNIADWFDVYDIQGDHFNENNVLVSADGTPIENSYSRVSYSSYNGLISYSSGLARSDYDTLTVNSALDIYKVTPSHYQWNTGYVDGVGRLELNANEEDFEAVTANSITKLDAYVTEPESTKLLENKDVFLDASAALTVEAILGEYQVKLILSGQRTAFNDGKFDLEMSYKLPDEENVRKFIAHMKTDEAGTFTVNNSEGVLLIMNELEEGSESNVIGTIYVGPTAVKAAEIQVRESGITIVYEDGVMETL